MIAVGIDVSKSKSTVAILSSSGEILAKPFDIQHIESELNGLISYLTSLDEDVKIVMEATGHYHLPILKQLLAANLFVCVMNPYLMKKYGDNEIRKGKTDKKDAMRMAVYALEKSYALTPYSIVDQRYADLKFLSRQYNQRIATKVKCNVYLLNLLDEVMPGIDKILMSKSQNPENNINRLIFCYPMIFNTYYSYHPFTTLAENSLHLILNSYPFLNTITIVNFSPLLLIYLSTYRALC